MIIRRLLATTAAAAGLLTSSVALANPAMPLSVAATARASAPAGASRIGADITGSTLVNVGILAALTIALVLLVDSDGESSDSN